jgi:hypothetical protein
MDSEKLKQMYQPGLHLIPAHMRGAVIRYLENGIPPGGFLTAVLSNDLMGAFAKADDENATAMRGWAMFVHNHMPTGAHGSPDKVRAWLASFETDAA